MTTFNKMMEYKRSDFCTLPTRKQYNLLLFVNVIISIALYSQTIDFSIIGDESRGLITNAHVQGVSPISELWSQEAAKQSNYSPLVMLSYRLNFYLSGLNAKSYHLVNIVLNTVITWRLMALLHTLQASLLTMIITSMLFIVHPIHSEAVASIAGRGDLIVAALVLTAWSMHVKGNTLSAMFCAAIALLTVPSGVILLPILLTHQIFVQRQTPSIFTSAMTFCFMSIWAYKSNLASVQCLIITPFGTLAQLLLPLQQCHAWPPVVMIEGLMDVRVGISLIIMVGCAYVMYGLRKFIDEDKTVEVTVEVQKKSEDKKEKKQKTDEVSTKKSSKSKSTDKPLKPKKLRQPPVHHDDTYEAVLLLTGVLLTFVSLLPSFMSSTIHERSLLLPLVGVCLTVAAIAQYVYKRAILAERLFMTVLFGMLIWGLSYVTFYRTAVWRSEETLHLSNVHVNPASSYANLGVLYARTNRSAEAENAYREALAHSNALPETHYNLGTLLQERGDYPSAIEQYRAALSTKNNIPRAHRNLGLSLMAIGKHDEAIKAFEMCKNIKGDVGNDCGFNMARTLASEGRHGSAIQVYLDLVESLPPNHANTCTLYNMLGESYLAVGLEHKAEMWFGQALRLKPTDLASLITMAKLMTKQDKMDEAEELVEKAMKEHPTSVIPLIHRAQLQLGDDEYTAAVRTLMKALALNPRSVDVHRALAQAYRMQDENRNALAHFKRATELDPKHGQTWANYGTLLHTMGKHDSAMIAYEKAIGIMPNDNVTKENMEKLKRAMDDNE